MYFNVPDEFKGRDQIAAGFESLLFWWSTINKNVDWINYLYYNQQRFVNYTTQAVRGLHEQLDKTSLMTVHFTFMHLADAFIQSDLHSSCSFTFYQLLFSLRIEPMILALLVPCSTI